MLLIIVLMLMGITIYGIMTNRTTPEERDEMLRDEEMFP
jgi:uncharacterized membrane protein